MEQVILLRDSTPAVELASRAIQSVVNGDIDPITAYINIRRMEAAIKLYKDDTQVRDITLRELSKYGKKHSFGDCTLEESEAGVKYDYSLCGDSKLADMYATMEALKADIKERETMLRNLPMSGMVDPDSGEIIYPPSRSCKTTIKTTVKRQ